MSTAIEDELESKLGLNPTQAMLVRELMRQEKADLHAAVVGCVPEQRDVSRNGGLLGSDYQSNDAYNACRAKVLQNLAVLFGEVKK